MPNARGETTNHDVRQMRLLHSQGVSTRRIAEEIGVHHSTVQRYVSQTDAYVRAHRYAAFVERASAFVPLLVPPSPF